jgi:branched-subunit amino acid ABC-type transport system permease component
VTSPPPSEGCRERGTEGSTHRQLAAGLIAGAVVALAAASCGTLLDEDQARLCRSIVPAIEATDADIRILRSGVGATADAVRIDYELMENGRAVQARHVTCRFRGLGEAAEALSGVETWQGPLRPTQMMFLRRFYLQLSDEAPRDPAAARGNAAPVLPNGVALALQQLLAALPSASIYGLLAASYALIHGLVGRVIFGFGDLAALGGYASLTGLTLAAASGSAPALAVGLLLALGVSAAYGVAAGRFAVLPALRAKGQAVVIATVGLMLALAEYARLTMPRGVMWAPPLLSSPITLARAATFGVTITPMQMLSAAVGLVAALGLLGYQRWSGFGRDWRAMSQDEVAAAMLGVNRDKIFAKSFAIASGLAGLAGYVLTVHFGQAGYAYGFTLGLKALVGAVLGGIGSVGAAFAGGVILAFGEAAWSAAFTVDSRDLAVYSLLAMLFVFRPYGLFGRRPDSPSLN